MRRQILPTLLAFVLGFGLGYVFRGRTGTSPGPSGDSSSTAKQAQVVAIRFDSIVIDTARTHVGKYKVTNGPRKDPNYHTVYAVWTALHDVETHFERKIKLRDLQSIQPAWATGIRVYEAIDGQNKAVNYLVFTDNSKTADGVPNDRLDAAYRIVNKKIDLTKEKVPRTGPGKEAILMGHIVCDPRCPDVSLL